MIIVMKPSALPQDVDKIVDAVEKEGLKTHLSHGEEVTIIGVVGDKTKLDIQRIEASPEVEKVVPITESYKLANKKFHPQPTSFKVKDTVIGPDTMTIMAGPCAVETEEQLLCIARAVKKAGATILRGGAYKPRTSPYSFQGLEEEGLKYMKTASDETGLATICEVTSAHAVESASIDAGQLQVGAMTAFITYTMQIVMAFLMLTMMSIMLPRAGVAADRIDEVITTNSSIIEKEVKETIEKHTGKVEFHHVNFRYPGADEDVLEDIDFTAEPGKTTAIIGSTGCGKSTLVNLIPRFYDVTAGKITLDGVDIRNLKRRTLGIHLSQ